MALPSILIFIKGIITGILVSIPLGPIGIILIQRTMNNGLRSGVVSGLGIATADTFYGILAAYGLTFITNFLIAQQTSFKIFGGIILLILGIKLLKSNPIQAKPQLKKESGSRIGDFFSMFFLTISNPMMIFMYASAFTLLGLNFVKGDPQLAFLVTTGIYVGAFLWWGALTSGVNLFRHRIKLKKLFIVNKISGSIIIGASIVAAVSVLINVF